MQETAITSNLIERLRATDEQVTIGLKHAAADEIGRLQQQVDTVRHLLIQASGLLLYPHHQDALIECQHALRQALEAVEMSVVHGGKNGSKERSR